MAKIIDNYILLELIGQGTFGEIHKGRNLISKEAVAVKTIKLDKFLNDNSLRDMIINEIQALKKLDDPHIVKMIKMLKSANNIYLVYEYLNGCQLCHYFRDKKQQLGLSGLPEEEALSIFSQICKAFKTLMREKILKKNLNMENIYIHEGNVKLTNFFVCKSNYAQKKFAPESFQYVAPELLQGQQPDEKCDVYSTGLILYELLLGVLPFKCQDREELIQFYNNSNNVMQLSQEIDTNFSDNVCYLLQNMLQINRDVRFGWDQVFQIIFDNESTDEVKQCLADANETNSTNITTNNNNNAGGLGHQSVNAMDHNANNSDKLTINNNSNNNIQQNTAQNALEQKSQQLQVLTDSIQQQQLSHLKKQDTLKKNGSIISQNKENIDYKLVKKQEENNGCGNNNDFSHATHKRESSLGLNSNDQLQQQLFSRSIQQFIQTPSANTCTNYNSSLQQQQQQLNHQQLQQNHLKQNKIIDLIIEKRSKIIIMTSAIQKCVQLSKYVDIIYLLLKKAFQISQQIIVLINTPEKVIPQLTDQEIAKWKNSRKKQSIVDILEQENAELLQSLSKIKDDFFSEGCKIYNCQGIDISEELNSLELKNGENIDQLIFQTAKQIVQQDDQREAIVLAHFLADIANLNNVFKKFLGKKRVDVLNHPYFKKLGEIQKEKLQENLESKFKLYEYQKLE